MNRALFLLCFLLIMIACTKSKYENTSSANCDLSGGNIRYRQTIIGEDTITGISGIIDKNCNTGGCHVSPPIDSTNTYDFTTYEGVKRGFGSIHNRIKRPVTDPLHMPIGKEMDPCDLAKLETWIQNGGPDN